MIETETVVYGYVEGASLLADFARPDTAELLPLVLSVHGGRWYYGTRHDTGAIDIRQWAEMGFAAMTIDYRLVTCTPAPACYQDMLCAIRWAHANGHKYRIDTSRIYLIGMSAGGHMVSLAATLGGGRFARTGGWSDYPADFRAAISVSGAYDLVTLDWGAGWVPPGEFFPAAREYASPLRHVSSASRPLLMLHSDDDPSIPIEQVLRMDEAMRSARALYRFVRYHDRGHMFITEEVIAQSRDFIESVENGSLPLVSAERP